ncbi:UNVERIFIED_CONTAM: Mitochondrial adenine nucleotide transporter ADNT1 [Sesamum radiatum]|uniref:Mitochondrial adenine nucleotide transporter ADNT1 n=1 Tax=Sesamum radiatum TaxID=300843 RepID=A0AAW2R136_SESRA
MQTEKSPYQYRGMFHALSTVLREEGFRALYKGWLPSVIGVVPYVGLNFAVYESLKDWLLKSNPYGLVEDNELGVVTRLACGAAAAQLDKLLPTPLMSSGEECRWKTVRHEGFRALYKGLVPNSVKVVPSIAIAFVTYEQVKELLGVEIRISD